MNSKWLEARNPIEIDVNLANEIGLKESIVLTTLFKYENLFKVNNIGVLIQDLNFMSIKTIQRKLRKLENLKLIDVEKITAKEKKDIISQLKNNNLIFLGKDKCEWCGYTTYKLEKHHYPIPKSEGGNKTVKICSNCHSEFHNWPLDIKVIINIDEIEKLI